MAITFFSIFHWIHRSRTGFQPSDRAFSVFPDCEQQELLIGFERKGECDALLFDKDLSNQENESGFII